MAGAMRSTVADTTAATWAGAMNGAPTARPGQYIPHFVNTYCDGGTAFCRGIPAETRRRGWGNALDRRGHDRGDAGAMNGAPTTQPGQYIPFCGYELRWGNSVMRDTSAVTWAGAMNGAPTARPGQYIPFCGYVLRWGNSVP